MDITAEKVLAFRLRAHHLDQKVSAAHLTDAAGACGLQNSPPGAWETALWNRVAGCTLPLLEDALTESKTLLQAWSFRGVPAVFPAAQSDVFLTALIAQAGESPWIYTRGITGALDYLGMAFDDLLARVKTSTSYLRDHTIKSKEALDAALAALVEGDLPPAKRVLWNGPSMYGNPQRQTVGQAAVSFLLRPCSFSSLVVFARRQAGIPSFTAYENWLGRPPARQPDADRLLVRKFLHSYGPTTQTALMGWLGCSKRQAERLWAAAGEEMEPVCMAGKRRYMLAEDVPALSAAAGDAKALLLLGPHDPYLDLQDRALLLADKALQRKVWRTVANPGAILRGGRIIGVWRAVKAGDGLSITLSLWTHVDDRTRRALEEIAEAYAAFRGLRPRTITVGDA